MSQTFLRHSTTATLLFIQPLSCSTSRWHREIPWNCNSNLLWGGASHFS